MPGVQDEQVQVWTATKILRHWWLQTCLGRDGQHLHCLLLLVMCLKS